MSAPKGRRTARTRPSRLRARRVPINPFAAEIFDEFIELLHAAGFDLSDLPGRIEKRLTTLPSDVPPENGDARIDLERAAAIPRYWEIDPLYCDSRGKPLALPVYGPAPSLEALCAQHAPEQNVKAAIEYLEGGRSIGRRGKKYVLLNSTVIQSDLQKISKHQLRVMHALLRTCKHKRETPEGSGRWYERASESPPLDSRTRARFLKNFKNKAQVFLTATDNSLMFQDASARQRNPQKRLRGRRYRELVAVFHTEYEEPPTPTPSPHE